ncbi:M15 family metallopeptidase [Shewanella inventionis]|uniref:Peptidase M15 n=1 Tax=Shewanella inventionis TaxID=1738770 RepID=A0ABQ1J2L7_9GAMM|nr:M15 family metallopeptidase [Shewanella inventionis]MCL1157397.1 M15 family metallopeptidase [Shewanella inventionis]GGB58536.1 peptidase M15 [Shewanella inventionis]
MQLTAPLLVDIPQQQYKLYGLDAQHLVAVGEFLLEKHTAAAFCNMQTKAAKYGLDLKLCSAFRPFERQVHIWNAKASGKRPLLDASSKPIDYQSLTDPQLIDAILIWSALPGASRHHWGTDIDVFDANQISKTALQLISSEYQANGPCFALYQWLVKHAEEFGFYFPYQAQKSGVSPEPWHLSFFPVAQDYLRQFKADELAKVLSHAEISLQSQLVERLTELVDHYVFYVAPSPAESQYDT